jgi:hypothetical protein
VEALASCSFFALRCKPCKPFRASILGWARCLLVTTGYMQNAHAVHAADGIVHNVQGIWYCSSTSLRWHVAGIWGVTLHTLNLQHKENKTSCHTNC